MQAPPVDWALPVAMLVGGLVIGTIVAILVSRRGARTRKDEATSDAMPRELEIRDLDAKRDSLFDQLRELDDTSTKRDADQLAAERYELELEAASTLRRLDELTGRHAPSRRAGAVATSATGAAAEVVTVAPPPSPYKGFLWGIGSAAAIVALVLFVAKSADERGEGGSMTGNTELGSGMQPAGGAGQADPELQQILSRVEANPNDLELRNELAFQQLMREQLMSVFETTQYVLERRPGDPAALTYQSVVRLAMGQSAVAEQMLKQAIEARPDLLDARVYLSLTYAQTGRYDEAKAAIDEAIRLSPAEADRLRQLWAQVEAQKASGPAPTSAGMKDDPHAGIALPPMSGSGAEPAPAPASTDPRAVRGTLALVAGGNVPRGAAVFLIVRPAGSKGGAPVAVARVDATSFPLSFEVSQANSMMGQPLPESMLIEARVDLDGNPMTRDAGAPSGAADNVPAGSTGVKIDLAVR